MTTVAHAPRAQRTAFDSASVREIRVAVLGLGQVGGAVATARGSRAVAPALPPSTSRPRSSAIRRSDARSTPRRCRSPPIHRRCSDSKPDVLVEVLGGIEPARTLVIAALNAGIPVVTANKTLLAYCGAELFATAAAAGVPLLYEASVLAGVPFLGTLGRRPFARSVTGFRAILNGTSNFILSRMARDGAGFAEALASAQRAGFAEPDPSKDVGGDDAVEKVCVLLRHLAGFDVHALADRQARHPRRRAARSAARGCLRRHASPDRAR